MLEEILVGFNWVLTISVGQIESCVQVGHVFAEMEGTVIHLGPDLIVDSGLHFVFGPGGVFGSSKIILLAYKHGDWNLVDLANFDLRSLFLAILLRVLYLSVVIVIKFATCSELPEMHDLFPRSWLRELRFVGSEAFFDIELIFIDILLIKVVAKFTCYLATTVLLSIVYILFFEIFATNLIHAQSL